MSTPQTWYPPIEGLRHPWSEENIVWRYCEANDRTNHLRELVESGADYIIREALVNPPGSVDFRPLSSRMVRDTLHRADREFERLRDCGITVPPVEWYPFSDGFGNHRVLGRVPVIDGEHLPIASDDPARIALDDAIKAYLSQGPTSCRLGDVITPDQYLIGQYRPRELGALTPNPTLCLVDIDPIFDIS